jgi:hypothetical protein
MEPSELGRHLLVMELLIEPGENVKTGDADFKRLATLDRLVLKDRWVSTEGRQLLNRWKNEGFERSSLEKLVGKIGGKFDLRGIPLMGQNLRGCDLSHCDLFSADFSRTNLYNADFQESYLSEVNVQGADLSWVKVSNTLMDNVKFDHDTKLIGIDLNGINTNFALNLISEARDQQRIEELKNHHPYFAWLLWLTCDYGRSLWRWSTWTIGAMLGYGLIFAVCPSLVHHPESPAYWGDGFYFSVITFTTLGYGDIYPETPLAKFLVSSEVIAGYLMGGIFVAILAKRVLGS